MSMHPQPKHGGARKGAGRKPLAPEQATIRARVTLPQRERFLALGGSAWLRRMLDKSA